VELFYDEVENGFCDRCADIMKKLGASGLIFEQWRDDAEPAAEASQAAEPSEAISGPKEA
jgi:hypothetical protein